MLAYLIILVWLGYIAYAIVTDSAAIKKTAPRNPKPPKPKPQPKTLTCPNCDTDFTITPPEKPYKPYKKPKREKNIVTTAPRSGW